MKNRALQNVVMLSLGNEESRTEDCNNVL